MNITVDEVLPLLGRLLMSVIFATNTYDKLVGWNNNVASIAAQSPVLSASDTHLTTAPE